METTLITNRSRRQNAAPSAKLARFPALAAAVVATLLVASPPSAAGQINGVYQPGSKAYGKTYAEWSAAWFQWADSLKITYHPLYDTAPIDTGQSGPVWFLSGHWANNNVFTRTGARTRLFSFISPVPRDLWRKPERAGARARHEPNGSVFENCWCCTSSWGFSFAFDSPLRWPSSRSLVESSPGSALLLECALGSGLPAASYPGNGATGFR
jgi:hypothetical protein